MQKLNWAIKSDLERAGLRATEILRRHNYQAFWVGGVVRNFLLKNNSDNIDIATDCLPDKIEKIFRQAGYKTVPVGKEFGSILVIIDKCKLEITSFRTEGRYADNRHPSEVEFISSYLEDAKRRDLTINALYFDPSAQLMYDPTGGLKDLKSKLIRFVGDPKMRIEEDGLRMLRAVRFAATLGFRIEKNSFAAIKTRAKYIQGISGERIKAELDKIMFSLNRAEGMKLLSATGLLKFIIPEALAIQKFSHQSKKYHLEGTIWDHTLLALSKITEADLNLIYAVLFHDIGKPLVAKKVFKKGEWVLSTHGHADAGAEIFLGFARRMKFPVQQRQGIEWLIRQHMVMSNFPEMNPRKQLKLAQMKEFGLLMRHWHYDETANVRSPDSGSHRQKYLAAIKRGKFLVESLIKNKNLIKKLSDGNLIMKLSGLKSGPQLGSMIEKIKLQIVEGKIKTQNDLKKFLQTT